MKIKLIKRNPISGALPRVYFEPESVEEQEVLNQVIEDYELDAKGFWFGREINGETLEAGLPWYAELALKERS